MKLFKLFPRDLTHLACNWPFRSQKANRPFKWRDSGMGPRRRERRREGRWKEPDLFEMATAIQAENVPWLTDEGPVALIEGGERVQITLLNHGT